MRIYFNNFINYQQNTNFKSKNEISIGTTNLKDSNTFYDIESDEFEYTDWGG